MESTFDTADGAAIASAAQGLRPRAGCHRCRRGALRAAMRQPLRRRRCGARGHAALPAAPARPVSPAVAASAPAAYR
eukprot:365653-Chlamydomonas_euryale.AAC.6